MKKVAVFIEELFNPQELIYPYHRLREDFEVDLIGGEADKVYTGEDGSKMASTKGIKEVNVEDYDGLYIPGGYSPDKMRKHPEMIDFAKSLNEANKPIAAVCHGGWMLASSIDLKGRKLTSTPTIRVDLEHAGAQWVDEETVVDGNIVTARKPADLPSHVKAFVELLKA